MFNLVRPLAIFLVSTGLVLGAACHDQTDRSSEPTPAAPPRNVASNAAPPPAENAPPHESPFEGTTETTSRERPNAPLATLRDVRSATQDGFDRIVFEFEGDALPGYHVEYVDGQARSCGSGEPVTVAGSARLEIRLMPAASHDDGGKPTPAARERTPGLPAIRQFRATCDFEADVSYVLGLTARTPYRVLELAAPSRIVVDVKHGSR